MGSLFEVFMPRQQCMRFEADVIWTHFFSDVLIAAAYYSIPIALLYFVRKRRDLAFHWMFVLFAAFILACGTTHIFNVWALWQPLYRLDGVVKAVTAMLSVATAAILWPLIPRALALPSPDQLRATNDQLATEVAERRRAEQELRSAQAKLIRNERLAVLGQLAGGVAHEIRNPLHVIKSSLYYLRSKQPDLAGKSKEHFERIEQHVETASQIVAELLDYARAPQSQPEPFALWDSLEESLSAVGIPPEVTVERSPPTAPILVCADRGQIGRIVQNLVRNAVQAMPTGGKLSLRVAANDGQAVAEVGDTGIGISNEDLPHVFEPLFTTKAKGIGLGLAISKVYAEQNDGRLEVQSEPGRGTTFRLVLPMAF
jgi:signal transduction histidine kinase